VKGVLAELIITRVLRRSGYRGPRQNWRSLRPTSSRSTTYPRMPSVRSTTSCCPAERSEMRRLCSWRKDTSCCSWRRLVTSIPSRWSHRALLNMASST